ncbi:HmuY family protein [Fontimonas sp. SYSU GA230001]|uniref:HmuY family protein n=1 Tax=Fontimonas sp. SYSU GA230001 TaxID=3142450 RepID=UPI0032B42776
MSHSHLTLLAASIVLGACAGDISPHATPTPVPETQIDLPGPGGRQARFTWDTAGWFHASIDASGSDWIYIDLDTQTQLFPADPAASDAWDIAHKGADIKLNGGVSGTPPSGIEVAVYADKVAEGSVYPFAAIMSAPPASAVDYVTDAQGSGVPSANPIDPSPKPAYAMTTYPAADAEPNPLTGAGDYGWYRYSGYLAGSVVSARTNVGYILRTVECRWYKLRMTGYTDADGTRGHPQYDLLQIPGGECARGGDAAPLGRARFAASADGTQTTVDASDERAWVYLDLSNTQQVAPSDPASDPAGWDLALRRTNIKLNGGASGAGSVAIHDGLHDDWASRNRVPADAHWHSDTTEALAFVTYPPREVGSECAFEADGDHGWYYYSGFCDKGDGMHHISPRDVVYLVRGRDGLYWKLRVLGYYSDTGEPGHLSLEFASITAP